MSLSVETLCDLPSHEQRRRLLGILSKKSAECSELLTQNAVDAICKLMRLKKDEAETLRVCALALDHLATTLGTSDLVAMQETVARLGLLAVLVESMKWNAERVELQYACMLLLGSIIGGSRGMVCQNLQRLAPMAMNQCLTNLRKFKDYPKVMRAAAVALTGMVYNHPENQEIFIKGHGIEIVVQAMQLSENRKVLKEACALLNNMCFESPVTQDRIAQRGCVPHIMKLLVDNSENDGAAEEACCLIANLAQLNQKIQRFMISNNAASKIAKVLQRPNVELIRWALAALGRLCEGSLTEAQDAILETRAINYVFQHVKRFSNETALQLQALAFFARLSENNVKVLKYLESTNVCAVVLGVIDTFIDSPTHAHFGAMTLAHLCTYHPLCNQVVSAQAINTILALMLRHRTDSLVAQATCQCLHVIALDNSANIASITRGGGLAAVQEILIELAHDMKVQFQAKRVHQLIGGSDSKPRTAMSLAELTMAIVNEEPFMI